MVHNLNHILWKSYGSLFNMSNTDVSEYSYSTDSDVSDSTSDDSDVSDSEYKNCIADGENQLTVIKYNIRTQLYACMRAFIVNSRFDAYTLIMYMLGLEFNSIVELPDINITKCVDNGSYNAEVTISRSVMYIKADPVLIDRLQHAVYVANLYNSRLSRFNLLLGVNDILNINAINKNSYWRWYRSHNRMSY